MEEYLQITTSAEYEEQPDISILQLIISVKASKPDKASEELLTVVNSIIDTLFESGLTKENVFFDGRETLRASWWEKKSDDPEISNSIMLKSNNIECLYRSVEKLAVYRKAKNVTIDVREEKPEYSCDPELIHNAMQEAMKNGREQALILAEASGRTLGRVLQVQEQNGDIREPEHGPLAAPVMLRNRSSFLQEEPAGRIERRARKVRLRYRMCFALQ